MSAGRRIFYNTVAQTLGKALAIVIGLVTVALLSRYLQEQGFGQYSTIIAYLGFFVVLADLGLYLFVVREISKPDTNHPEILSNALGLRLTASGLLLLAGAALALVLPYDPVVKKTMFVGVLAFVFVSLTQVLVGVFQKHLVMHLLVFSEAMGRAVNLLLVYFFVRDSLTLPFFILAVAASNGIQFVLTLWFARKYERFGIAFQYSVWGKILTASWPLVFAIVLNLLYFKTDTIILSLFQPAQAVGIYSLPYKVLEGLLAFPAMFVGLVMPLLSASAFHDWGKFKKILQYCFDALLLMAILVVITTLFFAAPIIDLIKGQEEYLHSPGVLKLLILSAGTIFLGTLFGYSVVAVNAQKPMIKGYLLGAAVGLLLYFILIPKYSYWGAAVGTLISEIVVASYAYILVKQTSRQPISLKILLPALPAILGLVLFFWIVGLPWILEIILGGLIYIALLTAFKAIPRGLIRGLIFARDR